MEYAVVMRPSWTPNNVHGRVPTQGQDDDLLGPVTKVGLGLGDCEHVGELAEVSDVNRR